MELLSEQQLRHRLALWTMKNSRFAPQPKSCGEAAFIESYRLPDTEYELVRSAIGANDTIVSIFKSSVSLAAWQSRSGRECAIVFCKAVETEVDSLGNTIDSVAGYSILNE